MTCPTFVNGSCPESVSVTITQVSATIDNQKVTWVDESFKTSDLAYNATLKTIRLSKYPVNSAAVQFALNSGVQGQQAPNYGYVVAGRTVTLQFTPSASDIMHFHYMAYDADPDTSQQNETEWIDDVFLLTNSAYDSTLRTFTLTQVPSNAAAILAIRNTTVMVAGTDFTVAGRKVVLKFAPNANDTFHFHYLAFTTDSDIGNGWVNDIFTTSDPQYTAATKTFTLTETPVSANAILAVRNTAVMRPGYDFTVSGSSVTLLFTPLGSDTFHFQYEAQLT